MSEPQPKDGRCDLVAERVALGEPLGELGEHAASCARCGVTVALPAQLAGSSRPHAAADPGMGFAARMTAGAQHRIVARKRRRVAGSAAAVVAACAAAVVVVAHVVAGPAPSEVALAPTRPAQPRPALKDVWSSDAPAAIDPDVRALVHLADIDRDLRGTAHWGRIEKPLRPYRSLVHGVKP